MVCIGSLLPSHFQASLDTYAPSILFRQWTETWEEPRKTGKRLPSEKKIAKPLFCRYITPAFLSKTIYQRAGVRVVEWARLESVCTGNSTEGSNPSLSAINFLPQYIIMNILRFSYVGGWGRNGEIETRYWTSHLRFAMLCKSTILQWFLPHRLTATKKFYLFWNGPGAKGGWHIHIKIFFLHLIVIISILTHF